LAAASADADVFVGGDFDVANLGVILPPAVMVVPTLSAWVHSTKGVISLTVTLAAILADLMPVALSAPVAGLYSMTAPSLYSVRSRSVLSSSASGSSAAVALREPRMYALRRSPLTDNKMTCSPTLRRWRVRLAPALSVV